MIHKKFYYSIYTKFQKLNLKFYYKFGLVTAPLAAEPTNVANFAKAPEV